MRKAKKWHQLIPGVDVKFGAPMGRSNIGQFPKDGTVVFESRVPMCTCCGAYDAGGVYWGLGNELRVKFTQDMKYIEFYRADPKMWHLNSQNKIDYFTIIDPDKFSGVSEVTDSRMALDLIAGGTTIDERARPHINTYFKSKIIKS